MEKPGDGAPIVDPIYEEVVQHNDIPQNANLKKAVDQDQVPKQVVNDLKEKTRIIVIFALGIFINLALTIMEGIFKIKVRSTIFLPLLAYDFIYFSFAIEQRKSKANNILQMVILANLKSNSLKAALNYLDLVAALIQDVLIYFFAFVICDMLRQGFKSLLF